MRAAALLLSLTLGGSSELPAGDYVPDTQCAACHADLARSFADVGMARSFYRPRPGRLVEDFSLPPFEHAPSGQHLQLRRDGERLLFRRFQLDPAGKPIHELEIPVDWVLGSGNHARTYLYQTPGGELYQLPLAWYAASAADGSRGRWGMAPGYDRPDHEGVLRRVRRECMACHNAYPDEPAGRDHNPAVHTYPAELPEGIGCQRCHGPGKRHVDAASGGLAPLEAVRAAIVNPGKLAPERRDDVCFSCHLQPSVVMPGVTRFGRGDYDFRPGQVLTTHRVLIDVEQELPAGTPDRFEINHHPYRLRQSRCFTASGGALSCLTCHDPHKKVPADSRATHYRAACLSCHQETQRHGATQTIATAGVSCVGCHMPPRRTQDVVQVVMTDHLIQRRPADAKALAPRAEWDPAITGLDVYPLGPPAAPNATNLYRAVAAVRILPTAVTVSFLERTLAAAPAAEATPYLDLVQGQLALGRFREALATLETVSARFPGTPLLRDWQGLALAGVGDRDAALVALREALAKGASGERAETWYNLGLVLAGPDPAAAREAFDQALAARPNFAAAWFQRGLLGVRQDQPTAALADLRRALAFDPGHSRAYFELATQLRRQGRLEEAQRVIAHGKRWARDRGLMERAGG